VSPTHIGHADPMGLDLMRALAEDLISFAGAHADIEFIRLAVTPAQAANLESAPPKEKANGAKGYNKMLIHLSTTGRMRKYTPDPEVFFTEDPMLFTRVGDLLKDGKHLYAKIDSTKTWRCEALDPLTLRDIVLNAINQRIDGAKFDQVFLEELKVRGQVLDRLDPDEDPDDDPDDDDGPDGGSEMGDGKVVEGKRDQLVGKLQERYGIARDEAERQVAEFERTHEKVDEQIPASRR
jgi:hypothetical protein